ncbi:hypothetical protein WJX73_007097 [Symbiochloris irregularis]|uniref:FAD-binding PCMH-type domain-containing protein n=1 Tax=Symbiochloris irregularis TaxID=706552 RepID=A0AAW1P4S5_9CHLO
MSALLLVCTFIYGLWAFAGAATDLASQVQALGGKLEGSIVYVPGSELQTSDTLANYLRRGNEVLFAPSVPSVFLTAASPADVVAGIKFALDNGVKVSLRGSGHNQAGTSLYPGGMTIDLSNLKSVDIDPNNSTAYFQPGVTGGEMAAASEPHGLHYRIGHVSNVSLSGYTLGGGLGWAGLAVDQIIGLDVVNVWEYPQEELAIKRIDADSFPDLFAAMQGAGQVLGAVVGFQAQLQPLPPNGVVRLTNAVWPNDQAAHGWATWNAFSSSHTHSVLVETSAMYLTEPGRGPSVHIGTVDWSPDNRTGTSDYIDAWVSAAAAAGAEIQDGELPYMAVVDLNNPTENYPDLVSYTAISFMHPSDTPKAVELVTAAFENATTPQTFIVVEPVANGTKSNNDTAFGWRGLDFVIIWGLWTRTAAGSEADGDATHVAWVKALEDDLAQYSVGTQLSFSNFAKANDTQICFPAANWAAVQAAKANYDPYNTFQALDFYHNDGGYGPLAATPSNVKPVSNARAGA